MADDQRSIIPPQAPAVRPFTADEIAQFPKATAPHARGQAVAILGQIPGESYYLIPGRAWVTSTGLVTVRFHDEYTQRESMVYFRTDGRPVSIRWQTLVHCPEA